MNQRTISLELQLSLRINAIVIQHTERKASGVLAVLSTDGLHNNHLQPSLCQIRRSGAGGQISARRDLVGKRIFRLLTSRGRVIDWDTRPPVWSTVLLAVLPKRVMGRERPGTLADNTAGPDHELCDHARVPCATTTNK